MNRKSLRRRNLALLVWAAAAGTGTAFAGDLDLAGRTTEAPGLLRLHGSVGDGALGVPVAGGADCDGDGHQDVAMASMLANPGGTTRAGIVYLLFGDSVLSGTFDTATASPRLLQLHGSVAQETAGSEIWIDDVTGDGLGDLLVGRQNFGTSSERSGTGALSIVSGGPALRNHAATETPLQLDAPPPEVAVLTIVGAQPFGRFGIWMRAGDIDGDGTADIVVGADQEQHDGARHSGAIYVIRGGPHLAAGGVVDLAAPTGSVVDGHLLRITPPLGSTEFHSGATCQIADLDGNGRGEVLFAAALNRAGATVPALGATGANAHGIGGSPHGTVYILWDDNFPGSVWTADAGFRFDLAPGSRSEIHGATGNETFGEEILGGLDFDGDQRADLFVGDIAGDLSQAGDRDTSGAGNVFYDAARLRGQTIRMNEPPVDLGITTFLGAERGDIAADTGAQGDFDGDGRSDLAFSAPHHAPLGRTSAGVLYVFFGQSGRWPARIDLRDPLDESGVRGAVVLGAQASAGADTGDTLAYSAATSDYDGDGRVDLVINEMEGNGLTPAAVDDGNLLLVSGALVAGQEPWATCPPVARTGCRQTLPRRSLLSYRVGSSPEQARLDWRWTRGAATTRADLGDPIAGATDYSLCLYDSGVGVQPLANLHLPAAAACAGGDCWRHAGTRGLRYLQERDAPEAIQRAKLRSGDDGRAAIDLRARGSGAVLPPALTLPFTVQLLRNDTRGAICWETRFLEALHQRPDRFVARGP
jgi:hypothetical protein